jgi:hypothetical protein
MTQVFDAEVVQTEPDDAAKITPLNVQELLAVVASVCVADMTIYRGHGYTGLAVFFLAYPALLLIGRSEWRPKLAVYGIAALLVALALRLCWYGSPLGVVCGIGLTFAFATALDRKVPFVNEVFAAASRSMVNGLRNLWGNVLYVQQSTPHFNVRASLSIVFPLIALLAFGGLFVLANPDAVSFFGKRIADVLDSMSEWLVRTALRPTELIFWTFTACVTAGLLRPILQLGQMLGGLTEPRYPWQQHPLVTRGVVSGVVSDGTEPPVADKTEASTKSPLYDAFRNTLLTVILLFAGYLIYEFNSLWFRSFPEGFYYAGCAHQGAAWLTIALALATVTLSLVFSGTVMNDPRLSQLRRLAWIWSAQNLILSLAVYNRLQIYVHFNGMTKMRVIGLFGTTLVVVGFLLVVWRIAKNRDFLWLLQRQLWALALAFYFYALTPVDGLSAAYNVRRVQQGQVASCMQLGVHNLDLEGTLALLPLLDSPNANIRSGVAARLADEAERLEEREKQGTSRGWTARQGACRRALKRLRAVKPKWVQFEDDSKRNEAISKFRDFAYQWY